MPSLKTPGLGISATDQPSTLQALTVNSTLTVSGTSSLQAVTATTVTASAGLAATAALTSLSANSGAIDADGTHGRLLGIGPNASTYGQLEFVVATTSGSSIVSATVATSGVWTLNQGLTVSAGSALAPFFRAEGAAFGGGTGVGVELFQASGSSFVQSYNRTSAAFSQLTIKAAPITFDNGTGEIGRMTGGVLAWGTTVITGASAGDVVIANTKAIRAVGGSGTAAYALAQMDANTILQLGDTTNGVPIAIPRIASTSIATATICKGIVLMPTDLANTIVFFDAVTGQRCKVVGTVF